MELPDKTILCEGQSHGSGATAGRPVDLAHLQRYTLGDRSLEREVLELFHARSDLLLQHLKEADEDKAWADAAHAIKGSARAIGAWHVAKSVEAAEAQSGEERNAGGRAVLEDLERLIGEANSYIESLLADMDQDASHMAASRAR